MFKSTVKYMMVKKGSEFVVGKRYNSKKDFIGGIVNEPFGILLPDYEFLPTWYDVYKVRYRLKTKPRWVERIKILEKLNEEDIIVDRKKTILKELFSAWYGIHTFVALPDTGKMISVDDYLAEAVEMVSSRFYPFTVDFVPIEAETTNYNRGVWREMSDDDKTFLLCAPHLSYFHLSKVLCLPVTLDEFERIRHDVKYE